MNDYQIFCIEKLPVNEMITENPDGSYTILINADLCPEKQAREIDHALIHIMENDFGKIDVQRIEEEAHGKSGII